MLRMLLAPGDRKCFIAIACLVCLQGLTVNLMPVMFSTFGKTFGLGLGEEGQAQSFFYFGAVLALLASGWITERMGVGRSGLVVFSLVGAGLVLIGLAHSFTMVRLGALVLGIGNLWVLSTYTAVVAERFQHLRQRMFMWILALLAASAIVGPPVLGYVLTLESRWQVVLAASGAAVWLLGWLWREYLGAELASPAMVESGPILLPARNLVLSPTLWLLGLLVILDTLVTGGIVSWTPRLFQIRHGADEAVSGLLLSALTVGTLAGRIFAGSFLSGKVSDRVLMGAAYALAMVAYGVLLVVPSQALGFVLVAITGALLSAQAPCTYSLATMKFAARAAVACPLVDAIGNLGGFPGPAGLGALADRFGGLESVIWILPSLGLVLSLIAFSWEILDRSAQRRTACSSSALTSK